MRTQFSGERSKGITSSLKDGQVLSISTLIVVSLITLIILGQSYQIASSRVSMANKLSGHLAVSGSVFSSSFGASANLSFSVSGTTTQDAPPIGISYYYDKGYLYSFGYSVQTENATVQSELRIQPNISCGSALTVQTPIGWTNGSEGQPALIAQNASNTNFVISQEKAFSGPTIASVLLGGVSTWPQGGAGLLIPPSSNYLFEISANGTGNINATITAYTYTLGLGFVPFATSPQFAINTHSYQNLTVVSNGWGTFSIAINATRVLEAQNVGYVPNIGPVGLWVGRGGSMNFESVFVKSGTITYAKLPPGTCHALVAIPFMVASATGVSILGPSNSTVELLAIKPTGQCSRCPAPGHGNLTSLSLQKEVGYLGIIAGRVAELNTKLMISKASSLVLDPNDMTEVDFVIQDYSLTKSV